MKYFGAKKAKDIEDANAEKQRQEIENAKLESWAKHLTENKNGIKFESTHVSQNISEKLKHHIEFNANKEARKLTGPLTPNRKGFSGRPITAGLRPLSLPGDELMPHKRKELLKSISQQIFSGYGHTRPLTTNQPINNNNNNRMTTRASTADNNLRKTKLGSRISTSSTPSTSAY